MNATSGKKTLLVTIAALVLAGASGAARADDMAGMKMDKPKTEKAEKMDKPAKEPAAEAKAGEAKARIYIVLNHIEGKVVEPTKAPDGNRQKNELSD